MNTKVKTYLFIIGLSAFLYGTHSFAGVRCGTQLIGVGDPEYVVNQACGAPINYHQVGSGANGTGDEAYAYYKVGNNVVQVHFIDGHVYTIDSDEIRN